MPWVRLDEQFSRHPKVVAAGPLGLAMQVAGLCYCNEYLTDGFVPRRVVPNLLGLDGIAMNVWMGDLVGGGDDATWQLVVADLIEAGLWQEVDGGYRIHDYHEYQPTKADVLAERKQKSEAGRLGGQRSGEARRARSSRNEAGAQAEPKRVFEQNASRPPSRTEAKPKPVPVPVPVTGEEQEQQQSLEEKLVVDVAREDQNLNGKEPAAAESAAHSLIQKMDEPPTDLEVETYGRTLPQWDDGSLSEILPLARQLTAAEWHEVTLRLADRVYSAKGNIRNQPGLLKQLLDTAIATKRGTAARAQAQATAERTPADELAAYAREYARIETPWPAALELLQARLDVTAPDEDHDALLEHAHAAYQDDPDPDPVTATAIEGIPLR